MLQTQTVDPSTLELIKKLQAKDYLKDFHLVGGTALALKLGHRQSIDIDLFSNFSFDTQQMLEYLSIDFQFNLFYSAMNTLKGSISNIQLDIVAHRYPYVNKPIFADGISMLSTEDIIAMKLNTITCSGQRVKDFIDIFFLLENYTLDAMLGFYKKKYSHQNEVNVLKSLIWFMDVDLTDWPVMIRNKEMKWNDVKKNLTKVVKVYLKKNI
ncbi:MAG: nucleotidyl transferase AbiEii/AbiGii toxin family protein [Bacteroidia bacterium]